MTVELTEEAREFCESSIYNFTNSEHQYADTMPWSALAFTTVDQLKRHVTATGSHWFDADTLRFFNSRIAPQLIGSRFFVSSERMDRSCSRIYRVRWVVAGVGEIAAVYSFEDKFTSLRQAYSFAKLAHKLLPFPAAG